MFAPELQNYLRVIYNITGKKTKFEWGIEQMKAFEKVKEILQSPHVMHMPRKQCLLRLYTDTSIYVTGSSVW